MIGITPMLAALRMGLTIEQPHIGFMVAASATMQAAGHRVRVVKQHRNSYQSSGRLAFAGPPL
jgi:hypothetical protein